jgi:hypothetical protein
VRQEIADQLLLLRIDRDDRMPAPLAAVDRRGDVAKLGVPIAVLPAFARLDVALERVAQLVQQRRDGGVTDAWPRACKATASVRVL